MQRFHKLAVVAGAAAGFSALGGVVWFSWLLLSSPSEPDGFGQDHQEQWAVATCWRDIRDGRFRDTTECDDYAQSHLDFFHEQFALDAATTTCNLSRAHLSYARSSNPDAKRLLAQLEGEVQADCSHPDVIQ